MRKNNIKTVTAIILISILSETIICTAANDCSLGKTGRKILPTEANEIFVSFQNAVKDSNWNSAINYCSNKIRAKAQDYNSPEEFFKTFLPIEKIKALQKYNISGWSNDNRYSCEIEIKDPNYEWSIEWHLEICKQNENWVMEFPTKPLNIWLKHAVLTSKVINRELSIDIEKQKAGYEYILTPLAEKFVIGQPMPFRIEMKNISNESLPYTKKDVTVQNPLIVTGPAGENIEYFTQFCSIGVVTDFTEPGEIVVLADSYDAAADYRIVKPGKYKFQFKGDYGTNSNIVEFEVKAGNLSDIEIITEKLKPIIPDDWILSRHISDKNNSIALFKKGMIKNPNGSVGIIFYFNPSESFLKKMPKQMELFGQSEWGPVYMKTMNAETHWPDYKMQIKNALNMVN
jgi:hypothetical protein